MRALSRNEIEAALLEDDMTIYPLVVPGHPSREERLANTDPVYPPRQAPLTPAQLDELRAKAPAQNPESHNATAAVIIAERQARQKAHDDKLRAKLDAATAAKGAPLSFEERQSVIADKSPEGIRRVFHSDGTWDDIAPSNKCFR